MKDLSVKRVTSPVLAVLVLSLFIFAGCREEEEPAPKVKLHVVETTSVIVHGDSVFLTGNLPFAVEGEIERYGFEIAADSTIFNYKAVTIDAVPSSVDGRFRASVLNKFTDEQYYCRAFIVIKTRRWVGQVVTFGGLSAPVFSDFMESTVRAGDILKIYGENFKSYVKVLINNDEAEVISASRERILFKVPLYKFAGPATLRVQQDYVEYAFENALVLEGPSIHSFTAEAGPSATTFAIVGSGFSEYTWRNTVVIFPENGGNVYNTRVVSASSGTLGAEIDVTNILPGKYRIGVGVDDVHAVSSETFEITTPWDQVAPKPGDGFAYSATFQIDNKLYFCTGATQWMTTAGYTSQVWEYDIARDRWSRKADFPGGVRVNAVGFSVGGKAYIGTGYGNNKYHDDFWEYDPTLDQWTQKSNFPGGARGSAVTTVHDGFAYVGLGRSTCCGLLTDMWRYDPIDDVWTQLSDFEGNPRTNAQMIIADDKLFVIGGLDSSQPFPSDTWRLDLTTNVWTRTGPLEHIHPKGVFVHEDKMYILHTVYNYFEQVEMHLSEFDPTTNTIVKDFPMYPGHASDAPGICVLYENTLYFGLGIYGGYGECLNELWKLSL